MIDYAKLHAAVITASLWMEGGTARETGDGFVNHVAEILGVRPAKIVWGSSYVYIEMTEYVTIQVRRGI